MTIRVQIPAYTDRWMMGDRYGEVVTTKPRMFKGQVVKEVHLVKLDKSGKTMAFLVDDCTEV